MQTATGQSKDKNGPNQNLVLDTTVYDMMFPDGSVSQYSANIIAENTNCLLVHHLNFSYLITVFVKTIW